MQLELTDDERQRYHEKLKDLLFEFDDFCEAHGIEYMLSFGTLLGAVRHHGFIPWDDDIDLMLTRPNFEKLCALQSELPAHLKIDQGERIIKFRDDRYHYVRGQDMTKWQPIFLDLFVMRETGPESETLLKLKKWIDSRHRYPAWHPYKLLLSLLKYPCRPIRNYLRNKADHAAHFTRLRYESKYYQDNSFPIDGMLPVTRALDFCGRKMPGPRVPDVYLKVEYGNDYMTPLPPEDRRFRVQYIDF